MKPPTHVEVMCPDCRRPIHVPMHCTLEPAGPGRATLIVHADLDYEAIETHRCWDSRRWQRVQ